MSEPMRVLYIHGGALLRGGTEAYMMNYFRNMDRTKVQIDFVVHSFEKGVYENEIEDLGGRIYRVPVKSKDPIGNRRMLTQIIRDGKYQIVHSHMDAMNAWNLGIAKKCGVPVRISHSHNTAVQTGNPIKLWLNEMAMRKLPKVATHLFACSGLAGKWLYRDKAFTVIPNAIDLTRFTYDPVKRSAVREALSLSYDDIVLGHVGRFSEQKNHGFFIDLMERLVKLSPRYKLVLIGDGHLKEAIREKMDSKDLTPFVRFVDACHNVNEYYNAFDYFCLPSLHEGLPVVGVEAQANGLRCLLADTISRETDICGHIQYLPINDDGVDAWVSELMAGEAEFRDDAAVEKMVAAGYEITTAARKLTDIYVGFTV